MYVRYYVKPRVPVRGSQDASTNTTYHSRVVHISVAFLSFEFSNYLNFMCHKYFSDGILHPEFATHV